MTYSDSRRLLAQASRIADAYLAALPERPVGRPVPVAQLRDLLGGPLPETGEAPDAVLERLAGAAEQGVVATTGPRYFGFVTGGSLPAAMAADWLTALWDQPAFGYIAGPAAAVAEEVAAAWMVELLGLGEGRPVSTGFTSGCTMGNFTALAAARHALLAKAGWDVEAKGLFGAPEVEVVVGAEAHASVFLALQMLGFGRARLRQVPADAQGRMRAEELPAVLAACQGPAIVCAQAGNVNSGAFDPLAAIVEATRAHGAWLHVDSAFGLWAAASPKLKHLAAGIEQADSWATDGHKWLNVGYDSGLVFVADPQAHHAAMSLSAAYLLMAQEGERDPCDWVPEASRRARGFAVYAALRSLGRRGLAELVERNCALAGRFAKRLAAEPGISILNDVVLNQVVVRFHADPGGRDDPQGDDAFSKAVIAAVQQEGTCWAGGTHWRDREAMRISVSNWSTTEADIERSADAIIRCCRAARAAKVA